MLPGLHVTAFSVLDSHDVNLGLIDFHIFTDSLNCNDQLLLRQTLKNADKHFTLEFHAVSESTFTEFPKLRGSSATYYRLLAPQTINSDRIIYLDVDVVCCVDVGELHAFDLGGHPAGFVQEGTIQKSLDRSVAKALGEGVDGAYLSAGIMAVDIESWRRHEVTDKCLAFLQTKPTLHDQSAMNYVLFNNWQKLDPRFNFPTCYHTHWPEMKAGDLEGKILHFMASPKPWNFLGEFIHPHFCIWKAVLDRTEMRGYRSWCDTPARQIPTTFRSLKRYGRAVLDRFAYSRI